MTSISKLGSVVLALALSGCVNVPVWERDVTQLDKLGKGIPLADVDKIFGRSTVLYAKTAEVAGKPYLFRHYELTIPTGRMKTQTTCYQTGGCISSYTSINYEVPFAVVFVGEQPRLLAWGKMDDLRMSQDPDLVAVLPQLKASYSDYLSKRGTRLF